MPVQRWRVGSAFQLQMWLELSLWERNLPANVTLLLAMESVIQQ